MLWCFVFSVLHVNPKNALDLCLWSVWNIRELVAANLHNSFTRCKIYKSEAFSVYSLSLSVVNGNIQTRSFFVK